MRQNKTHNFKVTLGNLDLLFLKKWPKLRKHAYSGGGENTDIQDYKLLLEHISNPIDDTSKELRVN